MQKLLEAVISRNIFEADLHTWYRVTGRVRCYSWLCCNNWITWLQWSFTELIHGRVMLGIALVRLGALVYASYCQLLILHTWALFHLCQAMLINTMLKMPSGIELTSVIHVHFAYAAVELTLITDGNVKKKSCLGINTAWKQPFAEFLYKWSVDVWLYLFNIYNVS